MGRVKTTAVIPTTTRKGSRGALTPLLRVKICFTIFNGIFILKYTDMEV